MAFALSNQQRAEVAARYKVWNSVIKVQRWWRQKYNRNQTISPITIKNCHKKLMTTGSILEQCKVEVSEMKRSIFIR
ncbi:hypothetical protein DERF_011014 [Dermatophagoides farinae]|uniref:Uncharacterized protein n=1 Tax=Dermatophagoides farinae TaxID=6954 RepID=A0A922L186_DERFA|nr:hypothetical protein DERF_011014 [Dermatophagoides farinae]